MSGELAIRTVPCEVPPDGLPHRRGSACALVVLRLRIQRVLECLMEAVELRKKEFAVAVVLGACVLRLRVCARVGRHRRLRGRRRGLAPRAAAARGAHDRGAHDRLVAPPIVTLRAKTSPVSGRSRRPGSSARSVRTRGQGRVGIRERIAEEMDMGCIKNKITRLKITSEIRRSVEIRRSASSSAHVGLATRQSE